MHVLLARRPGSPAATSPTSQATRSQAPARNKEPSIRPASQQQPQPQRRSGNPDSTAAASEPAFLGPAAALPKLQASGPSDPAEAPAPAMTADKGPAGQHSSREAEPDGSPAAVPVQPQPSGPTASTEVPAAALTAATSPAGQHSPKETEPDGSPAAAAPQLAGSTEEPAPDMTPEEAAAHRRRLEKTEINRKSQHRYRCDACGWHLRVVPLHTSHLQQLHNSGKASSVSIASPWAATQSLRNARSGLLQEALPC